jgi:sortase (surface protein transpeptidase)
MTPRNPARRWWLAAAVAGLVSLVAAGGLVARAMDGEDATAGDGISALTAPTTTPTPDVVPSTQVSVRDAAPEAQVERSAPQPERLRIPDLGVDAGVRAVGVEPDGAMTIPKSPTSVGWYRYGSAPADPEGNTVIAGHVATIEDGPGALARLEDAEPGMLVDVVDEQGAVHRYEVTGREQIYKQALPVDEIFARDGRPLLVLITCGGEYYPELGSHRDNVVVTATPVT